MHSLMRLHLPSTLTWRSGFGRSCIRSGCGKRWRARALQAHQILHSSRDSHTTTTQPRHQTPSPVKVILAIATPDEDLRCTFQPRIFSSASSCSFGGGALSIGLGDSAHRRRQLRNAHLKGSCWGSTPLVDIGSHRARCFLCRPRGHHGWCACTRVPAVGLLIFF